VTSRASSQLEDVWRWYRLCRDAFRAAGTAVERGLHFVPDGSELSLETASSAVSRLKHAQDELDDLVILALFAVFEREAIAAIEDVRDSATTFLQDRVERELVSEALSDVEEWRLVELLDVFKGVVEPATVGLVKQVKRTRDWVAHGKKGARPLNLNPGDAHARLRRFLEELNSARAEVDREENEAAGTS
jgi:hypothetical protein